MIAALDVDYGTDDARAACVLFADWADPAPSRESTVSIEKVAPYVPGSFYKRELPCLLAVLERVGAAYHTVVVDGHVWLGPGDTRPGLGAHLHRALGGSIPVVGVAKNHFADNAAIEVLRGQSKRPLYVTAVGIYAANAAAAVRSMHGAHRIPTLLHRVDRLARDRS